jgi:tetratricopeptide (TPR) repeat protein
LSFADAEIWERHHLPVADEQAYPCVYRLGAKAGISPADAKRLVFLEGFIRAIAQSTEEQMDSGRWTVTVPTFDGPREYHLALLTILEDASARLKKTDPSQLDPQHLRRAMERHSAQIGRLMAKKDFKSLEEANSFLCGHMDEVDRLDPTPRSPLEKAQDIMYDAWEARGRRRRLLAKKALDICPDCADAYVLLAEEAGDPQMACELFRKGVEAGKRALGVETFKRDAGHFWGILETRPYMRARCELAECLWDLDQRDAAVSHYKDLLRLNPNDNQGIRYLLAACLLEMGRDKELRDLLDQYDEGTAQWRYLQALAEFRRAGDVPKAGERLKQAVKANRYVPHYLLGRCEMPFYEPSSFHAGGEDEAVYCVSEIGDSWRATPGAIEWLEQAAPKKAEK